jgi:hypothetical protein
MEGAMLSPAIFPESESTKKGIRKGSQKENRHRVHLSTTSPTMTGPKYPKKMMMRKKWSISNMKIESRAVQDGARIYITNIEQYSGVHGAQRSVYATFFLTLIYQCKIHIHSLYIYCANEVY